MSILQSVLHPPVFADENRTRVGTLLYVLLLACGSGTTLYIAVALLFVPQDSDRIIFAVSALLIIAGLVWLVQRGQVVVTGHLMVTAMWILLAVVSYTGGGIRSLDFPGFIMPILIAGFVLGRRTGIYLTILTVIYGIGLFWGASHGLLPTVRSYSLSEALLVESLYLIVSAVILYLVMGNLQSEMRARKRVEDMVRASEAQFRQLFEANPHPMYVLDGETGSFLAVNDMMVEQYGYSHDEFLKMGMTDVIATVDMPAAELNAVEFGQQELGHSKGGPWRHRKKDGTDLFVEIAAHRMNYGGRNAVVCAAYDLTERLQAEEAVQRGQEVQKERELLALKQAFIAHMTHEFRTPLAVILGAKESLERYYDRLKPERRQEHFKNIDEQVHYVAFMLDEVLTLSKAHSGKLQFNPSRINLATACHKLFDRMQLSDTQKHRFVWNEHGQVGEMDGDPVLIQHMLINLLSNAIKYAPEGSEIRLEVSREGTEAVIQVSDQGIGIPEADQENLFEPFYRASNTTFYKGTGLGLAIVKESVEAHGGTIVCESVPAQGTTFIVRLPINSPH